MDKQKRWSRVLRLGTGILGAVLGLWLFGSVLLPFALGLIPAKAADKAVHRLQHRMPRWLAACLCVAAFYILLFLALWVLGQVLFRELETFFRSLPALTGALAAPISRLEERLLHLASRFPDGVGAALEQWVQEFFRSGAGLGETLYNNVFSFVTSLLRKAPDIGLFALTTVLSGFMLAVDLPRLQTLWRQKAPKLWQEKWQIIQEKLKGTLFCWLKAQGKLMLITFLVLTAGFLIIGIRYPLLFGLLIAFLDALPVLGSGVILIPWSMVQFLAGNTFWGVGLLCIYGAAALTRTALEPRMLGKQMGLDPLVTLLALYTGYRFFGIFGMILFPMGAMFIKQILN